jgi:seryl-tRNA synthetase/acyl carrier protein
MADRQLPAPEEFARQLTGFINATLLGGGDAVGPDTRLFEEGYINSLRILDLIAVVEKTLGRRIPDRAVRLANFRSVTAIVRAFHPDARDLVASASTDTLFEHRTSRTAFASPVDALVHRGDLTAPGAGRVALSGLALDVARAVDHSVARWATTLGAMERSYPSLIDLDVLERAGQPESFPQHLTLACHPERGEGPATPSTARHALAPAVCYHVYPEWQTKTLSETPVLLTAAGRCYRHEDGRHVPLERLWEFSMREIVVLGTREQVEDIRQTLVRRVSELVTTLGVDGAIELAADPFFTSGDAGRRLMQQAGALKYELRLTIDAGGRGVAAASFNHHHDFFGRRFDTRLSTGAPAHSGCVAFGLERWVLGLLSQHGVDERRWPDAVRQWLDDARKGSCGGLVVT